MGFTMSLFVAGLAFGESGEASVASKVGILSGSALAGIIGFTLLRRRALPPE
jgi:NhaA family Na+:H+ antiporter